MKKILPFLYLVIALAAPAVSAKPKTWCEKAVTPYLQIANHNAYTLTGCITTPVALYAAFMLNMIYSNLDKIACDPGISPEIKNMIFNNNPIVPAIFLAATWAGVTFAGGALTKSTTKAFMDAFDIPEQDQPTNNAGLFSNLHANITLDIAFNMQDAHQTRNIQHVLKLEDTNTLIVGDITLVIKRRSIDQDTIALDISITQQNVLISQPMLIVKWDVPASVTIGSNLGNSYSLSVTAHKA